MRFEGVRCDKCGAVKGETNHWWEVAVVQPWSEKSIVIYPAGTGDIEVETAVAMHDACSQACVSALVSAAMSEIVSPAPGLPPPA